MKYIKLFENFDDNDPKSKNFFDNLLKLEQSVGLCPSTKNITKKISKLVDMFNVYGFEKSNEIKKELLLIKEEIEKNYKMDDEKYLKKDDKGLKHAPTSQIERVLSLLPSSSNEIDEFDDFK
jgi:hypothetical protein